MIHSVSLFHFKELHSKYLFDLFVRRCASGGTQIYSGGPVSDHPYNKIVLAYRQQIGVVLQRAVSLRSYNGQQRLLLYLSADISRARPPWASSLVASAASYAGERFLDYGLYHTPPHVLDNMSIPAFFGI